MWWCGLQQRATVCTSLWIQIISAFHVQEGQVCMQTKKAILYIHIYKNISIYCVYSTYTALYRTKRKAARTITVFTRRILLREIHSRNTANKVSIVLYNTVIVYLAWVAAQCHLSFNCSRLLKRRWQKHLVPVKLKVCLWDTKSPIYDLLGFLQ